MSFPTIQRFATLPVLELPLQIDANLRLTVLIKCVLIKENRQKNILRGLINEKKAMESVRLFNYFQ